MTETSNYNNINNTYTYDDFSNRTAITNQTTYTYGMNNRLLSETGTVNKTYEYDANGNLRWERFLTPVNGTEHATPDDDHYYYNLDGFNRVVYIGNLIDAYTNYYNSDGLRTAKMINGVTTYYVLDGDNVIAETTNGVTTTYLRGLMLHSRKVGDTKTDYIYNTQGDVVQLLDSNGDVVADYKYDAFGNRFTETTDPNPFGYRGEFHDSCSGLIYLRNRYYDPSIGRFITEDPARDGLNWYVYCENNPVNFVDPLGLYYIINNGNGTFSAVRSPLYANFGKVVASLVPYGDSITYAVEGFSGVSGGTSKTLESAVLRGSLQSSLFSNETLGLLEEGTRELAGKVLTVYQAYQTGQVIYSLGTVSEIDRISFYLMNGVGISTTSTILMN